MIECHSTPPRFMFIFHGKTLYGRTFIADKVADVPGGLNAENVAAMRQQVMSDVSKRLNLHVMDLRWVTISRVYPGDIEETAAP